MGDKRKVAAPSCDGMEKSGKKWNGTEGEVKVMVAGTGIYGEKTRMSTRIITRLGSLLGSIIPPLSFAAMDQCQEHETSPEQICNLHLTPSENSQSVLLHHR